MIFNGHRGRVEVAPLDIGWEGPHMIAIDLAGREFLPLDAGVSGGVPSVDGEDHGGDDPCGDAFPPGGSASAIRVRHGGRLGADRLG